MSWTTRITKAPNGELRLLFPEPLSHIDMDRTTAKHFASLIADAAEGARVEPLDAESAENDAAKYKPKRVAVIHDLELRRRSCLLYLCIRQPLGEIPPANDEREVAHV